MSLSRFQVKRWNALDSFSYFGIVISRDECAQKTLRIDLAKIETHLLILDQYGGHRSTAYEPSSIFLTLSLNVLLYGSECCQVVETGFHMIEAF